MNMQQMVQTMQRMQREYEKAHKTLEEKEFSYTANNAIKVTMKGDMTLISIEFIDDEILEKDNAEMISDMLVLAYNNIKDQINNEEDAIAAKFKGAIPGGMGF